jgi:hypothetical protein
MTGYDAPELSIIVMAVSPTVLIGNSVDARVSRTQDP